MKNYLKIEIFFSFIFLLVNHILALPSIIRLYSADDNLALDVRRQASNGAEVTTWDINTSDKGLNQKWAVDMDLAFDNYTSFKSMDDIGDLILDEDMRSSTVIIWRNENNNLNRRWYFAKVSKYVQIVNVQTKRCLTNAGKDKIATTTICDVTGKNKKQLWNIENFSTTPDTWKESWDHNQLLERVYSSPEVAIYFDKNVNKSTVEWIAPFTERVWRYVRESYGYFGPSPRLYAIFHTDTYYGGHLASYYDYHHYHRNTIDCGKHGGWEYEGGWNTDVIVHEISHIVEFAYNGIIESPGRGVWRDSTFAEIFGWDVYLKTGRSKKDIEHQLNNVHDFPRIKSYWLRDWWVPMYDKYGGVKVLSRFFDLLVQYWPKDRYYMRGRMNYGEFFHFFSGAANANLQELATNAFGWTDEFDAQFKKARRDYPNIRY